MNKFNTSKEFLLKYILYFFPIFIILGNVVINFVFVIVFFIYLLSCLLKKKIIFSETYEFKFFLCFYVYLLINSLLAEDIKISLLRSIPYIKFFIFVLMYRNFIEERKINFKTLGIIWFIIIFILALDIIYQSIFGHDIFNYTSDYSTRNSGFFFDELVAGSFLVSFLFINIFLLIKNNNSPYIFLYFVFYILVVFLTGERASLLDFVLILICVYMFCIKSNLILKNLSILASILIIISIIFNFSNFKGRYLSTISFSQNQDSSLVETYLRSEYGAHTISSIMILKDNLLFGVGNKNFRISCKNYTDEVIKFQKKIENNSNSLYPNGCATHPHQIYNEFLSEHGLIGTTIIMFILISLLSKNISTARKSNLNLVCFFYIILYFFPILPSGSFFSTLPSTFFWINYLFYIVNNRKDD